MNISELSSSTLNVVFQPIISYIFFILKSCTNLILLFYSTELAYQPDTSHHNNPSVALPLSVPSLRIPTRITGIKARNQRNITNILRAHLSSSVVTRNVKIFLSSVLQNNPKDFISFFTT